MAYGSSLRRPAPYNYETPEQKARDQLRAQKVIAGVTTRANEQAQSVAALTALAKATGVPMSQLPAGGIHPGMSPADVQAATDRINGWVARQPGGQAGQVARTAQGGQNAENSAAIAGALGLPAPTTPAGASPSAPAPQTRTTPTGGTETLVQSESGPRWVASVNNAPAPNNQNSQVTRSPGPVASPVAKPWVPSSSPDVITPTTDAARIAFQYGDKTGGMVTNGPSAPGVKGYAGTGVGAPSYVPPAVASRVAADTAPKPIVPPVPPIVPPVPPIVPPTKPIIPGIPSSEGPMALNASPLTITKNPDGSSTGPDGKPWVPMSATTPAVPSPIPGMPPITGENPAGGYAKPYQFPPVMNAPSGLVLQQPRPASAVSFAWNNSNPSGSPTPQQEQDNRQFVARTPQAEQDMKTQVPPQPGVPSGPQMEQDSRQLVARTPQAEQDLKQQVPPQAAVVSAPQMEQNLKQQVPPQPDDEEEQRKRMAAMRATSTAPQPYQF